MGSAHPVVVLSRTPADNLALAERLLAAGLQVVELPTAAFFDVAVPADELRALRPDLAALAFTSPHGVAAWQRSLAAQQSQQAWQTLPCAAVGHKTAEALAAGGWRVQWTATEEETGAQLAQLLADALPAHSKVLIPQARHARPELVAGLTAAGHQPLPLVVYENRAPTPTPAALQAAADAQVVYAAAPSAVDRLLDWLPALRLAQWVAIGPTTAARLAERSPEARVVVAAQPSLDAVTAAVFAAASQVSGHIAGPPAPK